MCKNKTDNLYSSEMALYLEKFRKKIYMKKIVILFIGVLISGSTIAQAEKSATERAKNQTEKISQEANLTNEQKSKVYEINLGINQKNDALKTSTLSEEEQKKIQNQNNEVRKQMISALLTPEQKDLMKKKMSKKKEIRKKKMRGKAKRKIQEKNSLNH
jgi:hypothetical protein